MKKKISIIFPFQHCLTIKSFGSLILHIHIYCKGNLRSFDPLDDIYIFHMHDDLSALITLYISQYILYSHIQISFIQIYIYALYICNDIDISNLNLNSNEIPVSIDVSNHIYILLQNCFNILEVNITSKIEFTLDSKLYR